jgi:hypothetical protein
LAAGLQVEARAEDGLVEAYSIESASGFALAVQWHPEWNLPENPVSGKLYAAFGAACRRYRSQKNGGGGSDGAAHGTAHGADLPPIQDQEVCSPPLAASNGKKLWRA